MSLHTRLDCWPVDGVSGHSRNDESAPAAARICNQLAPSGVELRNELAACQEESALEELRRRRSTSDNDDDLGAEAVVELAASSGRRHLECRAGKLQVTQTTTTTNRVGSSSAANCASAESVSTSLLSQAKPEAESNQEQLKATHSASSSSGSSSKRSSNRSRIERAESEQVNRFLLEEREFEREREFRLRRARKSDRRRERERSASITSDYFSSAHNSPVVVVGAKAKLKSDCKRANLNQKEKQKKCERQIKSSEVARIYENPFFVKHESEKQASMKTQRRESSTLNEVEEPLAAAEGAAATADVELDEADRLR